MKIVQVGLSKDDLTELSDILRAEADTLKDVNGAPPVGPGEDYDRYTQLTRMHHACVMFYDQTVEYDTENTTDTDPAAILRGQVGTF